MSSDDVDAINTYIVNAATKTPEAGNLQAQWKTWYGNLNFISKALDSTFQEASNRRTVFNAANMDPENFNTAADLTHERAVTKQAAIASSTALSPSQKAAAIAKNPNIPTTPGVPGSAVKHATIRQGSKGSDVTAWQQIIGVSPADGNFGAGTLSATKAWQTAHHLTADGVVGPATWSAAVGAPVQEASSGTINSSGSQPFAAASTAFKPVSPSVAAHVADPKPTIAAITQSSALHTALKIGIPAVGLLGGGWFFGPIGAVIGGAAGLFGSTKVS